MKNAAEKEAHHKSASVIEGAIIGNKTRIKIKALLKSTLTEEDITNTTLIAWKRACVANQVGKRLMVEIHKDRRDVLKVALHSVAIKNLQETLLRLVKGDIGCRVNIWRLGTRERGAESAVEKTAFDLAELTHKAMYDLEKSTLTESVKDKLQTQAMKSLARVLLQIAKGPVGYVVYMWGAIMMNEKTEGLQERLRGVAHDMVKQILIRKVHGEVGYRLEIWRSLMRNEEVQGMASKQEELLDQMRDTRQTMAMKLMKNTMWRIAKGETSWRLTLWKDRKKEEKNGKDQAELAEAMTEMSIRHGLEIQTLKYHLHLCQTALSAVDLQAISDAALNLERMNSPQNVRPLELNQLRRPATSQMRPAHMGVKGIAEERDTTASEWQTGFDLDPHAHARAQEQCFTVPIAIGGTRAVPIPDHTPFTISPALLGRLASRQA